MARTTCGHIPMAALRPLENDSTKRMKNNPYRPRDAHNRPLTEARERFLEEMAKHANVLTALLRKPLLVWKALTPSAQKLCRDHGWQVVLHSPNWKQLSSSAISANPALADEAAAHLQLIPLCEVLVNFASKFALTYKGDPAAWAMETVVATLDHVARYPRRGKRRWVHFIELYEEYPAKIEPGWRNVSTGMPEEELFSIRIRIAPKQPHERERAFERRFNQACREARRAYVRELKAAGWTSRLGLQDLEWVDRLAQWQVGKAAREIDPAIQTPAARSAFSRGLKKAGDYIGITPRGSKHNPRPRS